MSRSTSPVAGHLGLPSPSRTAFTAGASGMAFVTGLLALCGWATGNDDLKTITAGGVAITANTSLSLVLLAIAILVRVTGGMVAYRATVIGRLLAATVALIAGLTLVEYATGTNLGLDTALFPAPVEASEIPGRMSLGTAICLTLLAIALITRTTNASLRVTPILGSAAATLAVISIFGHLYGSVELKALGGGSEMALPTAIALAGLAAAVLADSHVRSPLDVLARPTIGGRVARVLVLIGMILLPFVGLVDQWGENAGLYGTGFGISMTIAISGIGLSIAGIWLGAWLDQAEAVRRVAESELSRVIELSPDAICITTPEGTFEQLNGVWKEVLGYDPSDLRSRSFIDFVHPDDIDRTLAELKALVERAEATFEFVNRFRHRDGSYRTIDWNARFSQDTGKVYAIARDATRRIDADRERALLASIIETTDDAVIVTDLDGRIATWNPAAERMYEYATAEVVGRPISVLLSLAGADEVATRLRDIHDGATVHEAETVRISRSGHLFFVSLTASPLRDTAGQLIGSSSIARDVTAIHAAREALEAMNTTLKLRNRELRDFASVVSHDLQAPLRRLQLFAEMATELHAGDDELSDSLARIRGGAERMGALVSDLLAYARLGVSGVGMRLVDLGQIVEEARAEHQEALTAVHGLVEVAELPPIEGDPVLLHQLFSNLIGNALKFRRPEAAPVVTVDVRAVDDGDRGFVDLAVGDNGIGFEPEYADRIFGIFERLYPDQYEGTGIGLAVCRKVVELHGGSITATGVPGQGATFTIRLPLTQPKETRHGQ